MSVSCDQDVLTPLKRQFWVFMAILTDVYGLFRVDCYCFVLICVRTNDFRHFGSHCTLKYLIFFICSYVMSVVPGYAEWQGSPKVTSDLMFGANT